MKKLYAIAAFFLFSINSISFAATGDILYSNCDTGVCKGAGSSNGWTRTVETTGCYSGECLKLVGTFNGNLYGAGSTSISTGTATSGKNEITVVYYVKFNESIRTLAGANIKQMRPYVGDDAHYFIATIGGYNLVMKNDFYISSNAGTFIHSPIWDPLDETETWTGDTRFSINNGDGTWRTGKENAIVGKFNQGGNNGFGTQWTKVRQWIKLPSTTLGTDGESKLWINDELALHLYDAKMSTGSNTTFSGFTFYPSSEATESFEHWMDNMVIYEGYVPPQGTTNLNPTPSLEPASNLRDVLEEN